MLSAIASAQSYTATVQDASSREPTAFAMVQLAINKGTVTNQEGIFSIDITQLKKLKDSVYIASMGYEKVAIFPSKEIDTIIKIPPKAQRVRECISN